MNDFDLKKNPATDPILAPKNTHQLDRCRKNNNVSLLARKKLCIHMSSEKKTFYCNKG